MSNLQVILNHKLSKTLLYACAIRFSKCNALTFPFYMFLIYVKLYYKNKKFNIKSVPYDLIKQLATRNKDLLTTDINNTVIINASILKIKNINNIAKLQIYHDGHIRAKIVFVVGLNINSNELLISDALYSNLKLNPNSGNILAKLQRINDKLKFASYADISLINTEHDIINAVTDELLKNYFKTPKIIQKYDLIQIKIKEYCPKFYYTHNKINEINFIYFKCNKIKQDDNFDSLSCYYCCSDETTLKQSANSQSYLIPQQYDICLKEIVYNKTINIEQYLINTCPFGLQLYLKQIEDCMKPFLQNRKYFNIV